MVAVTTAVAEQERHVDPEQRPGALGVEQEARRPASTARTPAIRTPEPRRTGHAASGPSVSSVRASSVGPIPDSRRTGSASRPDAPEVGGQEQDRRTDGGHHRGQRQRHARIAGTGRPRPPQTGASSELDRPPGAPSRSRSRSARGRARGRRRAGTGTRRRAPRSRRGRRAKIRRPAAMPVDQVAAGRAPSGSLSIRRVVPKRTASDSSAGPSTRRARRGSSPSATET